MASYLETDIRIQMGKNKQVIQRKVMSAFDFMNEVGGFHAYVHLVVTLFFPLFNIWSIEKHLIRSLYRTVPTEAVPAGLLPTSQTELLTVAAQLIGRRQRIKPAKQTPLAAYLLSLLAKCFKALRRKEDPWYARAETSLGKELNIVRLIRGNRLVRNLLRLLTSQRERRLAMLQAKSNILVAEPDPATSSADTDRD